MFFYAVTNSADDHLPLSTAIGSVIRSEEQQNQQITWPSQIPLGMRPSIYVAPRKEQWTIHKIWRKYYQFLVDFFAPLYKDIFFLVVTRVLITQKMGKSNFDYMEGYLLSHFRAIRGKMEEFGRKRRF